MALAVAKTILDLLFPPLCIGCRAPVSDTGFFVGCWSALTFLDGPACACCGLPFPVGLEGENLCAACLARPRNWRGGWRMTQSWPLIPLPC
jgi:predicted amidophosphoribosyltransferase